MARDELPLRRAGLGLGNLSGTHGDWVDLSEAGYDGPYCTEFDVDTECGGVPVESNSWGAMKVLYR